MPALGSDIRVHQLPVAAASKEELADKVPALASALAAHPDYQRCDVVWAHYWISALAALQASELLGQPPAHRHPQMPPVSPRECAPLLAVSFHTIAAVKERDSVGHTEPSERIRAEQKIARSADVIVANTDSEASDIQTLLGAPPSRVVVASPGVNLSVFTPGDRHEARRKIGQQDADLIVLCIGRMQYIKGTDIAIDACARLRDVDPQLASRVFLEMLGAGSGGPATSVFEDLAATAGVDLTIREPVPAPQLANWYRAADVVMVPSRSESFGFAAAEAQASGACVLAAAVGGLPSVVDDGVTGELVRSADPDDWALRLQQLLLHPELRAELRQRASGAAQRYRWSTCVDRVLGALERTCAKPVAAPQPSGSGTPRNTTTKEIAS